MHKKKKKLKKGALIVLIIILLIIVYAIIVRFFLGTKIRNIYVHDNKNLSDWEIITLAKLDDYPNFYTTTSFMIEKRLNKNNLIKEVDVKKKFFHEIHLYIKEYKILFYYPETKEYIVDDKTSIKLEKDIVDVPILINYVPKDKYETLIEKLASIDYNVLDKISEIKYDPNEYDADRFLLYMNDENYVYILLSNFDLLNKYNDTITKLEGKKGILYLDSGNYFEIKN